MGGKGGGDSAPMMYQQQQEVVGRADPIDLTQKQEYINAQKAARDATADDPPTDTPQQGDDDKTPGDTMANTVLAAPNYWFNTPVSTLQPRPVSKRGGSMITTNDNSGSV